MTTPRWRALSSSEITEPVTVRWRIDLSYDGSGFKGFALQPDQSTVVGELREAIALTLRLSDVPFIVGAGRTDTGVHAFAQVIHLDLPERFYPDNKGPEDERLMRSLNNQLAGRITVHAVRRVSDDFHARHSATWRAYRYLVIESNSPALALSSAMSWTVEGPVDIDLMNLACQDLLGEHDFRAFCKRPDNVDAEQPLQRDVFEAQWTRLADTWRVTPTAAPALRFNIRAKSFCHQQVRSLTSTLVAIGQGKLPVSTIKERLESHSRYQLPGPAPAGGLSLIGVGYPEFAGGASGFVE